MLIIHRFDPWKNLSKNMRFLKNIGKKYVRRSVINLVVLKKYPKKSMFIDPLVVEKKKPFPGKKNIFKSPYLHILEGLRKYFVKIHYYSAEGSMKKFCFALGKYT